MKVRLGTIEVSDEQRRMMNAYVGAKGLATRKEVRIQAHSGIGQYFADMYWEFERKEENDEV